MSQQYHPGDIIRAINTVNLQGEHEPLYEIVELLGQGGMADVYKAIDLKGSPSVERGQYRIVALKVMNDAMTGLAFKELQGKSEASDLYSTEAVQRFLREVKSLSLLRSDHVVQILAAGLNHERVPYYACEFIEGKTLYEELLECGSRRGYQDVPELPENNPRPLAESFYPIGDLLRITDQILKAMEEFHGKGGYHRDIKPDNIMIMRDSRGIPTAKLLDFGIAKLSDQVDQGKIRQLTREGLGLGTPDYMSPEQAIGEMRKENGETVKPDATADLFSLAMTLFVAATGVHPYGARGPDTIFRILVGAAYGQEEFPEVDPAPFWPSIPEELRSFIMGGLKVKPWERTYQTAAEMRTQLAEIERSIRTQLRMASPTNARTQERLQSARLNAQAKTVLQQDAQVTHQVMVKGFSWAGYAIAALLVALAASFFFKSEKMEARSPAPVHMARPVPTQVTNLPAPESLPAPSVAPEPRAQPPGSVSLPEHAPAIETSAMVVAKASGREPMSRAARLHYDQGLTRLRSVATLERQRQPRLARKAREQALTSFYKARDASPNAPEIYTQIARLERELGRRSAALRAEAKHQELMKSQ